MFNTIDEVYTYIFQKKSKNKSFEKLNLCINYLDCKPKFPLILITGTNGKGSTALFIKEILKEIIHVGLFTSPYVIQYNERIMINDRQISNSEIMYYMNTYILKLEEYLKTLNYTLSFFEITFLISLLYYKDRNIDLGIFECGIGGLNDTCNVLEPTLSIITNIGLDHQNVLGNTKEEIALNKLGIARKNKTLLTSEKDIYPFLKDYCSKNSINILNVNDNLSNIHYENNHVVFNYKNHLYKTSLNGLFQAKNASLAIETVNILYPNIDNILVEYGIKSMKNPARLEILSTKPLIILDGAHNISAINEVLEDVKLISNNKKINILFVPLKDKNYNDMIKVLDNISSKYYFYQFDDDRNLKIEELEKLTKKDFEIIKDINDIKINDECLLVIGSLHFASFYRKNFKKC